MIQRILDTNWNQIPRHILEQNAWILIVQPQRKFSEWSCGETNFEKKNEILKFQILDIDGSKIKFLKKNRSENLYE